jgi:hypothetical protein
VEVIGIVEPHMAEVNVPSGLACMSGGGMVGIESSMDFVEVVRIRQGYRIGNGNGGIAPEKSRAAVCELIAWEYKIAIGIVDKWD